MEHALKRSIARLHPVRSRPWRLLARTCHRGESFGEERVLRTLEGGHGLAAGDLLELLRRSVLSFAGAARRRDDISFMVVRRTG